MTISAVDGTSKPVLGHFVKVSLLFISELAISSSFFPHFAWNAQAIEMAQRLMKEEGILAGISSGAAVVAANRISELPEFSGKTIVTVLPSSGERYLSTALFAGIFTEKENQQ